MKTTTHPLPENYDELVEEGVLDSDLQDIRVGELSEGGFVFTYAAGVQGHGWYCQAGGEPYETQEDALQAASEASDVEEWYGHDEEYEDD